MSNPLTGVREGMNVLDRSGVKIGSVEWVKLTDEDPETSSVEQLSPDTTNAHNDTLVDNILDAFRVDEVPDEIREQLLRKGFIRVDADGIFASDRYVLPEQVTSVVDKDVVLNVEKSDLIKRH